MSEQPGHAALGPELRRLAQAILDRLDPALRAAAMAATGSGGPGRCQQVWCPVCALAALVTGEQHPLLTVIAEHSAALTAVITAMVVDASGGATAAPTPPSDGDAAPPPPGTRNGTAARAERPSSAGAQKTGYQHIPIVVEPVAADE